MPPIENLSIYVVDTSNDQVVVEDLKTQLESALAKFVQLGRSMKLVHENVSDFEYGKELNRRYSPLNNEQVEGALLQLRKD